MENVSILITLIARNERISFELIFTCMEISVAMRVQDNDCGLIIRWKIHSTRSSALVKTLYDNNVINLIFLRIKAVTNLM